MNLNIRNLAAAQKNIENKVLDFVQNKGEMDGLAKRMQTAYRKNIREGFDSDDRPLKITAKTIEQRQRLLAYGNKKSSAASPGKANLTLTGDLVEKIKIVFTRFSKNKAVFEITFEGDHKPYVIKGKDGKIKTTKKVSILTIANGLFDNGYNLFGFPKRKKEEIEKYLALRFKRFLGRK